MTPAIRNIGIIAHVDHGKTTLVDCLLKQSGTFRENEAVNERAMDSMDLEREKGITIRSKNACIAWQGTTINLVDTPGHADFGGEVERIMKMVDGVLVLVDAVEGPLAQTRFVLRKAIQQNLALVFIINKIDREHADPDRVHDEVLDLLLQLGASEAQFHAPFLYASARDGYAILDMADDRTNMEPLFRSIIESIPAPEAKLDGPLQMLVSNLDWSDYVGRIALGKINAGRINAGDTVVCIHGDGSRERGVATKLYGFLGMKTIERKTAEAGDIVGLAGFETVYIGETICADESCEALPFMEIDPPTITMEICVNNGPLAGREGKFVTASHIYRRLIRETRSNVSLNVKGDSHSSRFQVEARGELQIAIMVETMRREGFELLVSRPEVIYHEENGKKLEPYETVWAEVPQECLGDLLQALAARRGETTDLQHHDDYVHVEATIPTRGLIGFESYLVNLTSGRAVVSHMFKEYGKLAGAIDLRTSGTLVCMQDGISTGYALDQIQMRGRLFIGPQEQVYEGMIIGENGRNEDLPVNPTRAKQLTNVRASGTDKNIQLEPPVTMSLERAIEYISADEYVEVTPKSLRLRKRILNATQRKRAAQGTHS